MNEHLTVGELFYCLIEDIEDYTMHESNEELDDMLQTLEAVKEKYDKEKLDTDDVNVLNIIKQYFEDNKEDTLCFDNLNFKQFVEDLNVILERIQNEIK